MKPTTLLGYINNIHTTIMKGWDSKANFENFVQIEIDHIFRTHLSNRIGLDTDGDKIQISGNKGVTNEHTPIAKRAWPKLREIGYTFSFGGIGSDDDDEDYKDARAKKKRKKEATKETADFHIENSRYRLKDVNANTMRTHQTHYWIELKVESPDTNLFGGKQAEEARTTDVQKLLDQAREDGDPVTGTRRRYWFIMLAFSLGGIGYIQSMHNYWTVDNVLQHTDGDMAVGIKEFLSYDDFFKR